MGDVVQESHEHHSYEQSVCIRASGPVMALTYIEKPQTLVENMSGLIGPMKVGGPISSQTTEYGVRV